MCEYLNSEEVLGVMSTEQGTLGGITLKDVSTHGHFPTRYVNSVLLTDPPERKITHLLNGGQKNRDKQYN